MSYRRSKILSEHKAVKDDKPLYWSYWFWCPGCDEAHAYSVAIEGVASPDKKPMWKFNGDMESPTFSPSLRIMSTTKPCHLFVKDGKIQFCNDCFHDLAGQTVPMVDIPDWL